MVTRIDSQNYVYNYLAENPIPSPEQELALYKQLLPEIKLDEVNVLANNWITEKNRVVMVSAPEKEAVPVPTNDQLLAAFNAAGYVPPRLQASNAMARQGNFSKSGC